MAELRDFLQQAAPKPPEFDETALLRAIAKRRNRRRTAFTVGTAALVAVIAIGVATNDDAGPDSVIVSPSSSVPSTTTTPSTTTVPSTTNPSIPAAAELEWRSLPAAPIAARSGAASAWTGSALVVWGGYGASFRALSDGAWFDPQARRWQSIRASPLAPPPELGRLLGIPVAGEVVIVSGTQVAAYTPGTDTWRVLPDVPLARVDATAIVQAGAPARAIVTGMDRHGKNALAWLDPADDRGWRTAAMREVWTGAVILTNGHVVYWDGPAGVDLDLATGAEQPIAAVPAALRHGYPFVPGAVAGSLVISPLAQLSWNTTTGEYKRLPSRSEGSTSVIGGGACGGATAWTGHSFLTWGGSECQGDSHLDFGAEYDPVSGALRPLPKFLSGRTRMASAWTGSELLVWGGQTDSNGGVAGDGAALSYAPAS